LTDLETTGLHNLGWFDTNQVEFLDANFRLHEVLLW
jgi:hypothetical protein